MLANVSSEMASLTFNDLMVSECLERNAEFDARSVLANVSSETASLTFNDIMFDECLERNAEFNTRSGQFRRMSLAKRRVQTPKREKCSIVKNCVLGVVGVVVAVSLFICFFVSLLLCCCCYLLSDVSCLFVVVICLLIVLQ